jgi:hypothetical protein
MPRNKQEERFGPRVFLFALSLCVSSIFLLSAAFYVPSLFFSLSRWVEVAVSLFLCLISWLFVQLLNKKLSTGRLGSRMQKIRSARFTLSFLLVFVACVFASALVFVNERWLHVLPPSLIYYPFSAILCTISALGEFFFTFRLLEGKGISRI